MIFSLRWRIAVGYALLLGAAIAAIGIVIVLAFQGILYDQAKSRVDGTMSEIVAVAQAKPNPFAVGSQTESPLEALINSDNIANWASPTTYVQVDDATGAVLGKSTNLAGGRFPSDPDVRPGQPARYRTTALGSEPFLVEDRAIAVSGKQRVVVHVGEPLDALERTFAQTRRAIVLILIGALIAVVVLSILLATQMVEPINRLAREMREIRSDRLDRRLGRRPRNDEIGQLTSSFDDLLERLEESFARERQFISDASHELRTPLTSINGNAQMLLRWGDGDEALRRESLETIVAESANLAAMVGGMLTLAKADRGDAIPKEPVALAEIAAEAVRNSSQRAAETGLTLDVETAANPTVMGERHLLRQLISNLIDNAIKFTETGSVRVRVGADATSAWVEVVDTGPGIPPDEIGSIFDRFYRADKSRSRAVPGTGLGLAIVRSIARVHDGQVTAGAAPGGGALFRAVFPRLDATLTGSS